MKHPIHCIVVDDDEFSNKISKIRLLNFLKGIKISTFTIPQEGLEYLMNSLPEEEIILFLDINMPIMNGWEFLEKFDMLSTDKKARIKVFILSSSLDQNDRRKASMNKYVIDYFVKPMEKELILNLFKEYVKL